MFSFFWRNILNFEYFETLLVLSGNILGVTVAFIRPRPGQPSACWHQHVRQIMAPLPGQQNNTSTVTFQTGLLLKCGELSRRQQAMQQAMLAVARVALANRAQSPPGLDYGASMGCWSGAVVGC